jgi:hypothetical protein
MLVVWLAALGVAEVTDVGAPEVIALEAEGAGAGSKRVLHLDRLTVAAGEGVRFEEAGAGKLAHFSGEVFGKSGAGAMVNDEVASMRSSVAD